MPSFYHKKSLGQNFLHNRKLLERISKIKKLCNENVIEIGPGSGSLTEFILRENPKNLTVIEKDEDLKPNLNKFKKRYPKNFNLIFDDALTFDLSTLTKKKIILIGNLPYNIATTLIIDWVKNYKIFKALVVMVQKEVAQRLYAKAGTKFYSRTSVLVQANASVEEKFEVSANNFFPQPKVNSSVIEITPKKKNFNYENLDKILKKSFLHRRKILKNNLKNLSIEIKKKIKDKGINLSSRPQDLSPDDYIKLSKILFC